MTPAEMAAIHAAAFPAGRGWAPSEIAALIAGAGGFAVTAPDGFALGRAIAGEAELLTIAVTPGARRAGTGRALLDAFEAEALARGAQTAFLEVADDNLAARGLYDSAGWAETGRRAGYYPRPDGAVDAVTMAKTLAGR